MKVLNITFKLLALRMSLAILKIRKDLITVAVAPKLAFVVCDTMMPIMVMQTTVKSKMFHRYLKYTLPRAIILIMASHVKIPAKI